MASTPAETPCSRNLRTAARRRSGRGARGSSRRARCVLKVVMVRLTVSDDRAEIRCSKSISRTTWSDLVVIETLSPSRSAIFSRIARVAPNSRSAGW